MPKSLDAIRSKVENLAKVVPSSCECGLSIEEARRLLFFVDHFKKQEEHWNRLATEEHEVVRIMKLREDDLAMRLDLMKEELAILKPVLDGLEVLLASPDNQWELVTEPLEAYREWKALAERRVCKSCGIIMSSRRSSGICENCERTKRENGGRRS